MSNASTLTLLITAIVVGAFVPFQAAANAALGKLIGYPLWATLVSLVFSVLLVLVLMIVFRVPAPSLAAALKGPWWIWVGGAAGVLYLTAALLLTPKLGVASFMVAVVAGQLLTSLLIDHFGLMGLPQKPVNMPRVIGLGMIIIGMIVTQMGSALPAISRQ